MCSVNLQYTSDEQGMQRHDDDSKKRHIKQTRRTQHSAATQCVCPLWDLEMEEGAEGMSGSAQDGGER